MAKDTLYEESALCARAQKEAKWYLAFHVIAIIFVVLAVFHAFFCFLTVPNAISSYKNPPEGTQSSAIVLAFNLILLLGTLATLALCAFLFFRFRRRFNVSYDYLFVEDELRVTKVFNGKRRKHLITMKAESVLQIGYYEKPSFDRLAAGLNGKKPTFLTSNREPMEGKEFIYILYSGSGMKTLYVIECRQMMLEYLVRAVGRTKFERE